MHSVRGSRLTPLLYVVAGLLVLDLLIARHKEQWNQYEADDYQARVDNCRRQQPDVVFVGGSPVSEGIDPAYLAGLTWNGQPARCVYNLGLPGGTTSDVYHVIQRSLKQPPRVLIYGICATDLNDNRNEPHGPQALMSCGDYFTYLQTRPEQAEWITRQFLAGCRDQAWKLYRYRTGLRLWCLDQLHQCCPDVIAASAEVTAARQRSDSFRRSDGFAPRPAHDLLRRDQIKANGPLTDVFPYLDRFQIGSHLRYLDKVVTWCEQHDVRLVLVDMPVSADLDRIRNPAEFALYRQTLHEYVTRQRLSFIDASHAAGLTDADFSDLIHINDCGSRKLAAWLRPQLEALGTKGATP